MNSTHESFGIMIDNMSELTFAANSLGTLSSGTTVGSTPRGLPKPANSGIQLSENNTSLVIHLYGEDETTRERKINKMLSTGYFNFSKTNSHLRRGVRAVVEQLLQSMDESTRTEIARQILIRPPVNSKRNAPTPTAKALAAPAVNPPKRAHLSTNRDLNEFIGAVNLFGREFVQRTPAPAANLGLFRGTTGQNYASQMPVQPGASPIAVTGAGGLPSLQRITPFVRTHDDGQSRNFNAGESKRSRRNDATASTSSSSVLPTCPKCGKRITVWEIRPYNHQKQNGCFYFLFRCCDTDFSNMAALSVDKNRQFKHLTSAVSTLTEWRFRMGNEKGKWRISCRGQDWTRCDHCKALFKNHNGVKSYRTKDKCVWKDMDPVAAGKAAAATVSVFVGK